MTSLPAAQSGPVTLADLYAATVADWKLKDRKCFSDLERRWRLVFDHFGRDTLAETLDYDSLTAYANTRMEAGAAPSTVQKELAYLRRGLNLVARSRRLSVPPFPTIKVENARQEFIDDNEFLAIRRELPPDLRNFFHFMWQTGWRSSEVASLTWEKHVDFERGVVRLLLYTTKNRDAREFPFRFLPSLEELLQKQRQRTDALERRIGRTIPTVFWRNSFNRARGGVPVKYFKDAWHNACQRAGVPGKKPHDFRRTAVRRLELASVPRSVAMKLVGHKSTAMYERYAIAPPGDLLEGVKRLAGFQGEAPPDSPRTPFDAEWQDFINGWWQDYGERVVDIWDLARLRGSRAKVRKGLRLLRDRPFTLDGGIRVVLRLVRHDGEKQPGQRPVSAAYRLERESSPPEPRAPEPVAPPPKPPQLIPTPFEELWLDVITRWWKAHGELSIDASDLAKLGIDHARATLTTTLRDRHFVLKDGTEVVVRIAPPREKQRGYRAVGTGYRLERIERAVPEPEAPQPPAPPPQVVATPPQNEAADEEWAGWL